MITHSKVIEFARRKRERMWKISWSDVKTFQSRQFICGHCGSSVASERGYHGSYQGSNGAHVAFIYICHQCAKPTFFDYNGTQVPGAAFGNTVKDISETTVEQMYDEARRAMSAGSYTAAVLCCRKLLMHIAVSKGAKAGDTFAAYVNHLTTNNYVPPDAKDWVDHIRKKGNEANHEIVIMKKDEAEELLSFIEMLLKVIYEFPAASKRKYGPKTTT